MGQYPAQILDSTRQITGCDPCRVGGAPTQPTMGTWRIYIKFFKIQLAKFLAQSPEMADAQYGLIIIRTLLCGHPDISSHEHLLAFKPPTLTRSSEAAYNFLFVLRIWEFETWCSLAVHFFSPHLCHVAVELGKWVLWSYLGHTVLPCRGRLYQERML